VPRVAPFRPLSFDPAVAGPLDRLTAPPYDVISGHGRTSLAAASPYNIVHLDLAERQGASDGNVYAGAARLLDAWRSDGILRSGELGYVAYESTFRLDGHERRLEGIFCAMQLEPWGRDVLPHEETMPGPVQDRLQLLRALRTHLSAVYGTIAGPCPELGELLDRVRAEPPAASIVDEEEVRHRIWRVGADAPVDEWLADEPLLIADGHHRYTTALAYRDEQRATAGPGPWDRAFVLVVDAGSQDVPVLPYHRVQLGGSPPSGGDPVPDLAGALANASDADLRYATIRRTVGGSIAYALETLTGEPPTVRALHEQVLDGKVPDDALRFTHDATDADTAVRSGEAVAAYLLPPTAPERIRQAVERGQRLPRKSTFFWPKPRTGLVMMPLS
jgi:uncharacterized protein (DUF1015 family)